MGRQVVVSLVFIVLLMTGGFTGAATGETAPAVDPDDVILRANVTETGTAHWQVEYRTRLDDENSTQAFEDLRGKIEQNSTVYRERFANRMRRTVADAENTTGRDMAVRNVTVDATREQLPQEYGVVTYRFTWTNFANVNDSHIRVGDALTGLFLDDETTLVVSWPHGVRASHSSPHPDDRSDNTVIWRGPMDFGDGEPSVNLDRKTTSQDGDGTPSYGDTNQPLSLLLMSIGVVVVSTTLGGVFAAYWRRHQVGSATTGVAATADSSIGARSDDLLSNDEQVLRLVEERGGRVKQADVAEELGWTAAKTSQVTKRLREAGELEAFRLGRENVLERPNQDDI